MNDVSIFQLTLVKKRMISLTAKEYLRQLYKQDLFIRQKIRELGELRMTAGDLGGIDYAKDRVQMSVGAEAAFTQLVQKIADFEAELDRTVDRFADLRHEIIAKIQQLPDVKGADILFRRYVDMKSWREIEDDTLYSTSYILRLHGEALREFECLFPEIGEMPVD